MAGVDSRCQTQSTQEALIKWWSLLGVKEPQGSLTEQTLTAGGPLHTWGPHALPLSKDRGSYITLCPVPSTLLGTCRGFINTEQGRKGEKKVESHCGHSLNCMNCICTLEAPASCQVFRWLLLKQNSLLSPCPKRSFLRQEQPVQFIFYMPSTRAMKASTEPKGSIISSALSQSPTKIFSE